MRGAAANRTYTTGERIDSLLRPLFDWFTGLPRDEARAFRDDLLFTVMLRPGALFLSGLGVLLMSGTAAVMTERHWAIAWLGFDTVMLALRLIPTIRYNRRGGMMPAPLARIVICSAFLMFLVFSAGCAASVMTRDRPLTVVATAAMMGMVGGLATRWAALPRLALPAILIFTTPFCLAVATAGHGGFTTGAVQFALVAASTAALAIHNNGTLIALVRAERRNRLLASTDPLTGLPNRAGLLAEFDQLRGDTAAPPHVATLFIDLDSFKAINDIHGHNAGDQVLSAVATRLREAAAPHFACRLGGDEFVVVIPGGDRTTATFVARHITQQLERPIEGCAAGPILASASVGIAFGSLEGRTAEQILAEADEALYLAKEAGGGRHAVSGILQAAGL